MTTNNRRTKLLVSVNVFLYVFFIGDVFLSQWSIFSPLHTIDYSNKDNVMDWKPLH